MEIRKANEADWPAIWPIVQSVAESADSFPYAPDISSDKGFELWMRVPDATYVAVVGGEIVGTYYLKSNSECLGAHVCNAGYMVAAEKRRRGIGRAMCSHSLRQAKRLGFRAMQFNLVVETNTASVELWTEAGFDIVGTLPGAFRSRDSGYVSALVMYRSLV